jgi:hypothetical protein
MDDSFPPLATDVFRRALSAAMAAPGETIPSLAFAIIVAVGYWTIRCRREGRKFLSLPDGAWQTAMDWAGVMFAALAVLFGAHIIPAVYERDAAQQRLIRDAQAQTNQLREELDAIRAQPSCPETRQFSGMMEPRNWSEKVWTTAWNTTGISIDWPTLGNCEATANVSIRIIDANTMVALPGLRGMVRILVLPSGEFIGTREVTNRDPMLRIPLPRADGRMEYQIQVRVEPNTGMGVDGGVSFAPR